MLQILGYAPMSRSIWSMEQIRQQNVRYNAILYGYICEFDLVNGSLDF